MKDQDTPYACNLNVLEKQEQEEFESVAHLLFDAVKETLELEKGYAFRFLNQPSKLVQIAQFIERESRCCPFVQFKLDVEASTGPVWLSITGEDEAKAFLQAELDHIRNLEH